MQVKILKRLLIAPFIGAAFVLFLPIIGFVAVGEAVLIKLRILKHE